MIHTSNYPVSTGTSPLATGSAARRQNMMRQVRLDQVFCLIVVGTGWIIFMIFTNVSQSARRMEVPCFIL